MKIPFRSGRIKSPCCCLQRDEIIVVTKEWDLSSIAK